MRKELSAPIVVVIIVIVVLLVGGVGWFMINRSTPIVSSSAGAPKTLTPKIPGQPGRAGGAPPPMAAPGNPI